MLAKLSLSALLCLACVPAMSGHHGRRDVDDATPGAFDYYLLSLSWSPNYCLTHEQDRGQCGRKGLGFVLHGTWPQFDAGNYPQYCQGDRDLSGQAAALGRTLYPSPKLMQHEWESHGSCSGLDAVSYFKTADRALAKVQVPAMFEAPPRSLTLSGGQIVAAFRSANPLMPDNALTVACSHGQLSEVRICLTRELALRSCGQRLRSTCPDGPVQVLSSR
jgi:ribonuclease T2